MKYPGFIFLLIIAVALSACDGAEEKKEENVQQQQGPSPEEGVLEQFRAQLNEVVNLYFSVKDGLVKERADEAGKRLTDMMDRLDAVNAIAISQADRHAWSTFGDSIRNNISMMQQAQDIEAMRNHFRRLSQHVYMAAMKFRPNREPLYWEYCKENENAIPQAWLSQTKRIQNPYTGERSGKCGEIVDEVVPLER